VSIFEDAIAAFNRGDYFAAAEMFENAAAGADEDAKQLAGALNRVAAALHLRLERGGRQAAINLLSQAMLSLDGLKPARGGIDVEVLFAEVSAYVEEIRASARNERDGIRHRTRLFLERRRAPKIKPAH
jgi:hypothetical protein